MYIKNRAYITGFLGRDAEVCQTSNNNSFTILSVATKRSWRDRQAGELKSETTWHRCIAFGKLAGAVAPLAKGEYVQLEGEIRTREYASLKDGSVKSMTEIAISFGLRRRRDFPPVRNGGLIRLNY